MSQVYYEKDVNPAALRGKRVAVLGYGSQGRGQSLNLRDSGVDVRIGLREGSPTAKKVREDGLVPETISRAVEWGEVVVFLLPDHVHEMVFERDVKPFLAGGKTLLFSHGFSVHFGRVKPSDDMDVAMVAPKGPGNLVREMYEQGSGVPCLLAVHRDATGGGKETALAYAHAVGGTRAGVFETTFAEETETDLFGEQGVLCGGLTGLMKAGFETLTEAGYAPEMAYFECVHEMKLIVDLIYRGGLAEMHKFVSDTASYGSLSRADRVAGEVLKARMKEVLGEVRDGGFANEWMRENETGRENFRKLEAQELSHPMESVGAKLRSMMPWLNEKGALS